MAPQQHNPNPEETFEPLTDIDDLKRIYIRSQDEHGHWQSINCFEATNAQFDTWIRTRITVQGNDEPWELTERLDVCNVLWQGGGLTMLKKDIEE